MSVARSMLAATAVLVACDPAQIAPRAPGPPPLAPALPDAGMPAPPSAPTTGGLQLPDAAPPPDVPAAPAATCSAERFEASPVGVDLIFIIDQSPSMLYQLGGRTKWSLARDALGAFLRDPRSAGLGVGFLYFPTPSSNPACATDQDCGFVLACKGGRCVYPLNPYPSCAVVDYTRLSVPIAPLPANEPVLTRSMMREPYAMWGSSPVGIAANGVFKYLRGRPPSDRQVALVMVTDGRPSGCFSGWIRSEDIVTGLAAEVQMQPSIRTYVIGLFSEERADAGAEQALTQFAAAGGTGTPFFVRPATDVNAAFINALDQIRAASLPCEYRIPPDRADTLDFHKVNLHYKGPAREEDVPYVERAERCDPMRGGWYYDVPPTMGRPTRVIACPATCAEFKSKTGKAEVSLAFGCKTRTID